jgi:hypothetical protein
MLLWWRGVSGQSVGLTWLWTSLNSGMGLKHGDTGIDLLSYGLSLRALA